MTHKIIKTENYLLIVDDSEIRVGDWIIETLNRVLFKVKVEGNNYSNSSFKKIIAHLPLNNAPVLEGVDLLPPLAKEDEVEELADKEILYNDQKRSWWKQGYNKAKEKYKWSDEDVIRIVDKSRKTGLTAEYLMLSLQQPKMPVAFECDVKYVGGDIENSDDYDERDWEQKTTTNSQGLNQWVGKYIY